MEEFLEADKELDYNTLDVIVVNRLALVETQYLIELAFVQYVFEKDLAVVSKEIPVSQQRLDMIANRVNLKSSYYSVKWLGLFYRYVLLVNDTLKDVVKAVQSLNISL